MYFRMEEKIWQASWASSSFPSRDLPQFQLFRGQEKFLRDLSNGCLSGSLPCFHSTSAARLWPAEWMSVFCLVVPPAPTWGRGLWSQRVWSYTNLLRLPEVLLGELLQCVAGLLLACLAGAVVDPGCQRPSLLDQQLQHLAKMVMSRVAI